MTKILIVEDEYLMRKRLIESIDWNLIDCKITKEEFIGWVDRLLYTYRFNKSVKSQIELIGDMMVSGIATKKLEKDKQAFEKKMQEESNES